MRENSMTVTAHVGNGNYGQTRGDGNGGNNDTGYVGASESRLKPGDILIGPYGKIIINAQGKTTMNGIVMTEENSSMVWTPDKRGLTRVLNSMIPQDGLPAVVNPKAANSKTQTEININLALKLASSWAAAGQISSVLINDSILDALKNQSPLTTPSYKTLGDVINAQPSRLQKHTADQISGAWNRAYNTMPDKVRQTITRGGSNGGTSTKMVNNPDKRKLGAAIPKVTADIQKKLAQKKAQENAAKEAAIKESQANDKARQAVIQQAKAEINKLTVPDAQDFSDSATKDANLKHQAFQNAAEAATAKRQLADKDQLSAIQADKSFNDLQNKVYGMEVKDGKYGYYTTRTSGGSNGTTKRSFSDSGVSVLDLDKARKNAYDMRQAADRSKAEAGAAEAAAKQAARASFDAETRRQATQAALASAVNKYNGELLIKASEVIAAVGKDVSEKVSSRFKALYDSIAGDIKKFQGKSIRSYQQAMSSLNAILENPSLKINKADREAIINAWHAVDANSFSMKYGYLSKTFKIADITLKVRAIKEKSIEGYKTGNWNPLMLEVESWVLAGVTSSAILGLLSLTLTFLSVPAGIASAITIAAIIGLGVITSYINANRAAELNASVAELIK